MDRCLFVYGTLLPGYAPPAVAAILRRLRPIGAGSVRGRLYDLGRFPGAVLNDRSGCLVHGRLFRLPGDRRTLEALDAYEGDLFERQVRLVTMADGRRRRSWVYAYCGSLQKARILVCGRYRRD
jgi:gamma-glutamylcyclotransferase (GGCT)/AIG2-like uncharacterized protein YtfP